MERALTRAKTERQERYNSIVKCLAVFLWGLFSDVFLLSPSTSFSFNMPQEQFCTVTGSQVFFISYTDQFPSVQQSWHYKSEKPLCNPRHDGIWLSQTTLQPGFMYISNHWLQKAAICGQLNKIISGIYSLGLKWSQRSFYSHSSI